MNEAHVMFARLRSCTAPRKLYLALPGDRALARDMIRRARALCKGAQLAGYDTHLRVAAALAQLEIEQMQVPPVGIMHVRDTLARAAVD